MATSFFTFDQSEPAPLALKSANPLRDQIMASSIAKSKVLQVQA